MTGDASALAEATRAADWIVGSPFVRQRWFQSCGEGCGRSLFWQPGLSRPRFSQAYEVTADRKWLARAEETAQFAADHFRGAAGYVAFQGSLGKTLAPKPQVDENTAFARPANRLHHDAGVAAERTRAGHATRFLVAPGVEARRGFLVGGILMADRELSRPPLRRKARCRISTWNIPARSRNSRRLSNARARANPASAFGVDCAGKVPRGLPALGLVRQMPARQKIFRRRSKIFCQANASS